MQATEARNIDQVFAKEAYHLPKSGSSEVILDGNSDEAAGGPMQT